MLSKTSEYALRGLLAIAAEEGPLLAREISTRNRIPGKYLSKVLRDLVHAGILEGVRGIQGGFRLRRQASRIRLIDVIRTFDDPSAIGRCPLGCSRCSDRAPCAIHDKMRPVRSSLRSLLEETTIGQLLEKRQELEIPKRA